MSIDDLRHEDVNDYVHAHLILLETTYAHLVDPAYARHRWDELPERIASAHEDIDTCEAALRDALTPPRRHLIARSSRGVVVGLACAASGIGDWEEPHLGDDWVAPPVTTNLSHLYTMPGTHGTGLGQQLLDRILPDRTPAYLWALSDNERAVAFYRRNGFRVDLGPVSSGDTWGRVPMVRMVRDEAGSG